MIGVLLSPVNELDKKDCVGRVADMGRGGVRVPGSCPRTSDCSDASSVLNRTGLEKVFPVRRGGVDEIRDERLLDRGGS